MEFRAKRTCQYAGRIYRAGNKLVFGGQVEECERCAGTGKVKNAVCPKCKGAGRSNPPHHFELIDKDAEVKAVIAQQESEQAQIEAIRSELTAIGASFDRRWGLVKLKSHLIEAKKERGE